MPDVKEHGLIFTAESVLGILAGRKTMTRRVVTAHNSLIDGTGRGVRDHWQHLDWSQAWVDKGPSPAGNPGPYWKVPCSCTGVAGEVVHRVYPRILVGDSIYAKETWKPGLHDAIGCLRFDYRADCHPAMDKGMRWKSPLFMPRRASRLVIQVVRVGAERVREIDWEDAVSEGLLATEDTLEDFMDLWDSINGDKPGRSFADDPPVWVYEWAPLNGSAR